MTWSLLLATHAFAASVALPLGAWQLFRPTKGDHQHRLIGRTWVDADALRVVHVVLDQGAEARGVQR